LNKLPEMNKEFVNSYIPDIPGFINYNMYREEVSEIIENMPINLIGEPGIGKTTLLMSLAKDWKIPIMVIPINNETRNFHFEGSPLADGSFRPGFITNALLMGNWMAKNMDHERPGDVIIVLDERNLGEPNVIAAINQLTDFRKSYHVGALGIQIPIECKVLMASTENPGLRGTFKQNEATVSRFFNYIMDFPPKNVVHEICKTKDLTPNNKIINAFYNMRKSSKYVTMRLLFKMLFAYEHGLSINKTIVDQVEKKQRDAIKELLIAHDVEL